MRLYECGIECECILASLILSQSSTYLLQADKSEWKISMKNYILENFPASDNRGGMIIV
jgi:hypothetical protein